MAMLKKRRNSRVFSISDAHLCGESRSTKRPTVASNRTDYRKQNNMASVDLNLLVVLDVLLTENSVVRAAERLELSPSALSRSLSRLRASTGDPLLVRAGRELVPTPLALELRKRVRTLVEEAQAVLFSSSHLDLDSLRRTFSIRANDGFIDTFGADLVRHIEDVAPHVRIRFAPKPDKDVASLRDGFIDLEVGVVGEMGPELHVQALFNDRFVGVIRADHPLSGNAVTASLTAAKYAAFRHVSVSRRGRQSGPIDQALAALNLKRTVSVVVPNFTAALTLARESDLIASVPERQTERFRAGMQTFALPVPIDKLTISQIWHPRFANDPSHRWLRSCLRTVCASASALQQYDVRSRGDEVAQLAS